MTNDARLKANRKYMEKAYDELRCRYRKELRLNEQIELVCIQNNKSKAQYITEAIQAQLDRDGITPDMLPDQE